MNKNDIVLELPCNKLPDCWNDNTQMNVLFAPFRSRTVNSQDWDFKQTFWKNLINTWCEYHKRCHFKITELNKAFRHNNCSPACILDVVEEMKRTGEIQSSDNFSNLNQSSWSSWAIELVVKKPFYWSYNKIKNSIMSPNDENTIYINTHVVQKLSEQVILKIKENFHHKIFTLDKLNSLLASEGIDEESAKFCVQFLYSQKNVCIETKDIDINGVKNEVMLIKLKDLQNKNDKITEIDRAVFSLEENEKSLMETLEHLEEERESHIKEAKTYMRKEMKTMAKNCLRKKHAVDKCIEKRASVLENIQVLLSKLTEAECNAKVFDAYREGTNALKNTFKDEGINEDTVADLIVEVEDVLDTQNDIQAILGQPISSVDESELEEELAELLAGSTTEIPTPPTEDSSVVNYDDLEERLKKLRLNSSSVIEKKEEKKQMPSGL